MAWLRPSTPLYAKHPARFRVLAEDAAGRPEEQAAFARTDRGVFARVLVAIVGPGSVGTGVFDARVEK